VISRGEKQLPQWDSYVNDSGVRIGSYYAEGEDDPIVIVGGLGSTTEQYQGLAWHLAQNGQSAHVVDTLQADKIEAIDSQLHRTQSLMMPWYGMFRAAYNTLTPSWLTPALPKTTLPFDIDHFTDVIDDAVDRHVTDGHYTAFGHSWGGIAVEGLLTQPERAKRIGRAVLMNTVPGIAVEFPSPAVWQALVGIDRSPDRLRSVAGTLYGGVFADHPTDDMMDRATHMANPEASSRQLRASLSALALRGRMSVIDTPVLVIGDTGDPMTPLANQQALAQEIPGARLVQTAGYGHMGHLTHPQKFADHISAFAGVPSHAHAA